MYPIVSLRRKKNGCFLLYYTTTAAAAAAEKEKEEGQEQQQQQQQQQQQANSQSEAASLPSRFPIQTQPVTPRTGPFRSATLGPTATRRLSVSSQIGQPEGNGQARILLVPPRSARGDPAAAGNSTSLPTTSPQQQVVRRFSASGESPAASDRMIATPQADPTIARRSSSSGLVSARRTSQIAQAPQPMFQPGRVQPMAPSASPFSRPPVQRNSAVPAMTGRFAPQGVPSLGPYPSARSPL